MNTREATSELRVETEIQSGGESRPRRFFLGTQWLEILEVLDCWLGSDYRYFKVRTDDTHVYILRQVPQDGHWSLTLFSREEYWKGRTDAPYLDRPYLT